MLLGARAVVRYEQRTEQFQFNFCFSKASYRENKASAIGLIVSSHINQQRNSHAPSTSDLRNFLLSKNSYEIN